MGVGEKRRWRTVQSQNRGHYEGKGIVIGEVAGTQFDWSIKFKERMVRDEARKLKQVDEGHCK